MLVRRLAVPAALLVLVLLPGCGGGDGTPSGEGTPATPAPDASAPAATAPATGAPGASDPAAAKGPALPTAPQPEQVVATVNGTPILQKTVYEVANRNKVDLQAQGRSVDDLMMRRAALRLLVDSELLVQQARAQGLTIDPKTIETELQAVKAKAGSEENYNAYLKGAGLTDEAVRAELERRLLAQAYMKSVTAGAAPDESKVREFYEANKAAPVFQQGEEVRASMILVLSNPDDPPAKKEEARKRAEEAHKRAVAGEDFAGLAKQYSQAPSASKGGDLGFFPKGAMFPKFEEVAFSTPIGQVSGVFETPTGYNVIKVLEKKEPRVRSFDEIKAPLTAMLRSEFESGALQQKLVELRGKAEVKILDAELAVDPSAAPAAPAATTDPPAPPAAPAAR